MLNSGYTVQCQELWIAVLRQAIAEERDKPGYLGSRDFFQICALAGVDGQAVLDRLKEMDELPKLQAKYSSRPEEERKRAAELHQKRRRDKKQCIQESQ